jgi:DNA-directed RNA polymerase subunit N (RpoN/RPB10)
MPLPPTRCTSCGRVIADKYVAMNKLVREAGADPEPPVFYYSTGADQKSAHGRALDQLRVTSSCCRAALIAAPR